jgi:hypothetical protein
MLLAAKAWVGLLPTICVVVADLNTYYASARSLRSRLLVVDSSASTGSSNAAKNGQDG